MNWLHGGSAHAIRAITMIAGGLVATSSITLGLQLGSTSHGTPRFTTGHLTAAGAAVGPRTVAAPTATTMAAAPPTAPAPYIQTHSLPTGKGMWMYQPKAVEGAIPAAIVARAKSVGVSHLFVRTGSSKSGFYAGDFLGQILPVAHAAGIKIYGWDFPYFHDVGADVARAMAAMSYTTPDGHKMDGFSADIEFPSMGVKLTPANASAYGAGLRALVGPDYPLIATVPRPSRTIKFYPYDAVVQSFSAIAPMVYWLNREPVSDVTGAIADLKRFGKPIMPIGQAYDGAADHGPPGVPGREAILAFIAAAGRLGAPAISFWSWQHASLEAWEAIRDAPEFRS